MSEQAELWADYKVLAEQVADTRRRAGAAEATVARVREVLDVDGQWYSGPLLARKIEDAIAENL